MKTGWIFNGYYLNKSASKKTTECSNTGKVPGIKKIGGFHREGVKTIQVLPDTTIREAMKLEDSSSLETILVIDEGKKLLGLVTDGDTGDLF
jgi:CBS domain-containing protein